MGDQEDEVNVFELVYTWLTHTGQEVDMVREPAETKDDNHSDQHHYSFLLLVEILSVLYIVCFIALSLTVQCIIVA